MLNEPSDSPKKNNSESPSPAWKPNRGTYNVPQSHTPPVSTMQQPQPAPAIRRPGCVTVTAGMFFLMALLSMLGILQALLLLDVPFLVLNILELGLALITVYGLVEMYRWGANLVIIFCAATIFQIIVQAVYSSLIIGDYTNSPFLVTSFIFGSVFGVFLGLIVFGLIMRWYVRVRKWFLSGNLSQPLEHQLYLIAILIFLASTVFTVLEMPNVIEAQIEFAERFSQQSVGQ